MGARSGFILNLDAQEHSGDNLPRSMPFGMPATQGERITAPALYHTPFFLRVNEAVEQLKSGTPLADIKVQHGIVVYRAAIDKMGELAPAESWPAERKRGRPPILRPCERCGKPVTARGMSGHKRTCK